MPPQPPIRTKVHTFIAQTADELKTKLEDFIAIHTWARVKTILQTGLPYSPGMGNDRIHSEILITIIYEE